MYSSSSNNNNNNNSVIISSSIIWLLSSSCSFLIVDCVCKKLHALWPLSSCITFQRKSTFYGKLLIETT